MADPAQLGDQDIERFVHACVQDEPVSADELRTFRQFLATDSQKARDVALRLVDERLIRGWFRSEADAGFVTAVTRRLQPPDGSLPALPAKLDPGALPADAGQPGPRSPAVPQVGKDTFLKYLLVPLAAALLYLAFVAANQWRQARHTPPEASPGIAAATAVRGPASLLAGQERRPLEPGASLHAGDLVHTGADAAATLRWPDGSQAQLGADTEAALALSGTGGTWHLHLRRGSATVRIARQPDGQPALITTGLSQLSSTEGAAALASTADRDRVQVAAGRLTVQRIADGASVILTAGQRLDVTRDAALTPTDP